MTKSVANC